MMTSTTTITKRYTYLYSLFSQSLYTVKGLSIELISE